MEFTSMNAQTIVALALAFAVIVAVNSIIGVFG